MSSLSELLTQKAELDARIAEAKTAAFESVIGDMILNAEINGFELDEVAAALMTEHNKRQRAAKSKPRKGPAKPAKFRHIVTGSEWNGVGRKPTWMADSENVRTM